MDLGQIIRDKAQELLASQQVECVMGYERATDGKTARPLFAYSSEGAAGLIFDQTCVHNLAKFLLNRRDRPTAIVAKPCDARSINLLLHENGHNWNLEHRSGNIMNPSILRTPTYWVKREGGAITYQDNSYPTLKRFFGGEPIDQPTPPPPPPPTSGKVRVVVDVDDTGSAPTAKVVRVIRDPFDWET